MFSFESKKLVRKIRPTTKLSLEVLEDRALPSVSTLPVSVALPPAAAQNAALASFVGSIVSQWNDFLAAAQQQVFTAYQAWSQQIAQEASSVQLQLNQILGISPIATNPPSNIAASQPVTHTATTTNQVPPQSHQIARTSSVASPDISNAPAVSNYLWDPPSPGTDLNASTPGNWLLNGVRATSKPGTNPGDAVNFDPGNGLITDGNGDKNINWDYNPANPLGSMNLGGKVAYLGLQAIQSGIIVELKGVDSLGEPTASLTMFDPNSSLNLQFSATTSKFQIDNNATFTNFQFTVAPSGSPGEVDITGGNSYAGGSAGYRETTQVPIRLLGGNMTLAPDAVLGSTVVVFQNGAWMYVGNGSTLTLDDNSQTGTVFMQGDGNNNMGQNGEELFVNYGGTVIFYGGVSNTGVGDWDGLYIPVKNEGDFNLFGTPARPNASPTTLFVNGNLPNLNVSYWQAGISSAPATTYLSGGVNLDSLQGYRQALTSYLIDGDSNPESVSGENAGVYIGAGSSIVFNHNGSSFGTLYLIGNVSMYGRLQVNINGLNGASGNCDLLRVLSNIAWYSGSSISVYIYGFQLVTGQQWGIMKVTTGSLTGINNVTVSPNTLWLDSTQWNNGWGTLDS